MDEAALKPSTSFVAVIENPYPNAKLVDGEADFIDEDGSIGVNILLIVESTASDTGVSYSGCDTVAAIEEAEGSSRASVDEDDVETAGVDFDAFGLGSDESAILTQGNCRTGLLSCTDKSECIYPNYVCDGDKDCRDGSDEIGCGHKVVCNEPHNSGSSNSKRKKEENGLLQVFVARVWSGMCLQEQIIDIEF
ncbi:hypothetical protein TNCV_2065311 [Trichonephila clavipes]|nr:hypothetical protein TNCV_2065311 [Trichonephila clavipes]